MTDDQQWQAPGFGPPPPHQAVPPTPPAALGYQGAPQGWSPSGTAPGWTPPPKPGLIPLRPLTLGTILGAAFQTLRRNPSATLAPALILTMLVAVIQVVGSASFLSTYLGQVTELGSSAGRVTGGQLDAIGSSLIGFALTSFLAGLLSLFVTALVQAIVTMQVASSTIGSRLRLGSLWRRLRGRRGAAIGWAAITGGAVLIAVAVVALVLVAIGATGPVGVGIAVLLGLVLGAGLFVAFVWLWVKLGFVPAAIVVERASIRESMRRSWRLTRGAFWRIFGIRLLVIVMISVATSIVTSPISLLFSLGGVVLQPNGGTTSTLTGTVLLSTIVTQGVTAIITAVGLVISTSTTSLLYLDRRMRLEGLDLDLARFVERRAAGEQGLRDPYLPAKPALSSPVSGAA